MQKTKLLALVGPTAVGKSAVALALAASLDGEVISCDSMQVYRQMDIGTAKAGPAERRMIPHHMLDLVDPDYDYTVAEYQQQARRSIEDVARRGRLPLLVGGSGLYYQAVADNYDFLPLSGQAELRRELEQRAQREGLEALYAELQTIDPAYADKISANDRKRIIRALEVFHLSGQPFSQTQRARESGYELLCIGLAMERPLLYRRIEERVERMLADGLIAEVDALRRQGYGLHNKALNSLGYRQVLLWQEGRLNYEAMVDAIKTETRRFAKRQMTWFKRDPRIHWIDCGAAPDAEQLKKKIIRLLTEQGFIV